MVEFMMWFLKLIEKGVTFLPLSPLGWRVLSLPGQGGGGCGFPEPCERDNSL